jgi:DNA-binding transcriptional LysR family regulator
MEVAMDLSLTRVLCAVYEARSVSRAAEVLRLTQPAVSHALGRLRQEVADPLFVRTTVGMVPTPQADQLYLRFREALQLIGEAVDEARAFDPKTSTRRFRISLSDIGVMVFLPLILRQLQAEAPDIAIQVCQIAVPDLLRALEAGQIDFALGNLPALERHTEHYLLFDEHYVCVLREMHSVIASDMSRELFLATRHVAVISPFSGHRMVEDAMVEHGLHRRIVLETPHFTSVPDILAQTDLIATVPSRVATLFAATHRLRCLPLPIAMAPFTVGMYWHKRNRLNQGHNWLRSVITRLLSAL